MSNDADAIVIGAGLSGLVAACELADAGRKVIILDQEGPQSLGGQAFWSLGGLFLVDTPEQRRWGIRDSLDLAWSDWLGTAGFDRDEDHWPRKWARAYVEFAAGGMRDWLRGMGLRIFPVVGWAERGGAHADGHGNSVPRFHLTWGTGPGVIEPFEARTHAHVEAGLIRLVFRHRVDGLVITDGRVTGVQGAVLADDAAPRGASTNREVTGDFALSAGAVIVASGGIGGNLDLVRRSWPERLGPAPKQMVCGVPDFVDGRMQGIAQDAGARIINADRMWHYTEGLRNWDPIWPNHGIRILPGPSSMWFDARGDRLPAPNYPGYDSLSTLAHITATGFDYSWFITTQSILKKEFSLSGSEQNPDLTGRDWKMVAGRAFGRKALSTVEAFKQNGADFTMASDLGDLVTQMNAIVGSDHLDPDHIRAQIEARDRQIANPFSKDAQVMGIHNARRARPDRLIRCAKPHRILDPAHGPLIGVKLNLLTRKTLGGLETDLDGRCFAAPGQVMPGLYAVGEVAGFGGGGYHGYRALEGTFLGGCLFSGRQAGRAAARDVAA